ncbi:MAG TPA: site-2 protease family protein [Candidatus Angelobacter sp.]|nr:site-2 protease family protein [Candidatus Angelobacter sp.]
MDDRNPLYPPPGGGQLPPQPPIYQVTSDIPPSSQYHYSPAPPRRANRGILGGLAAAGAAAFAYGKYALLILFKIPFATTLVSLLVSFGAYAVFYGPWFAVSLVTMILVHEMGHVVEIRRQGMQATAPIFIPFLGAAIFQRSHPTSALKQAQIGIAGPIAGTLGATAAFALYAATQNEVFLLAAWLGFFLNLFNLVPVWQLDGAWVLAPVSKWFQAAGYAAVAALALFHVVSIFLIVIALLGVPTLIQRFRNADNPYYTSVPTAARWALGAAWLALVLYLGFELVQTTNLLSAIPR